MADLRAKVEVTDFPDLDIGKETLNRIRALDVADMSANGLIQAAKKLRGKASELFSQGDREAGSALKDLADEVDDLLYRNVPDQSLATNLQAARQRIAKTYDVQNAL